MCTMNCTKAWFKTTILILEIYIYKQQFNTEAIENEKCDCVISKK